MPPLPRFFWMFHLASDSAVQMATTMMVVRDAGVRCMGADVGRTVLLEDGARAAELAWWHASAGGETGAAVLTPGSVALADVPRALKDDYLRRRDAPLASMLLKELRVHRRARRITLIFDDYVPALETRVVVI